VELVCWKADNRDDRRTGRRGRMGGFVPRRVIHTEGPALRSNDTPEQLPPEHDSPHLHLGRALIYRHLCVTLRGPRRVIDPHAT
jgi:hypothetical protein